MFSYREGMPLTLFEAMASGLPVVATPVNGVAFEISNGKNGFLVKYGDIISFKKKILEILDNKVLRDKIAKNNTTKAANYDWDIIARKTEDIYNNVIKHNSL